MTSRPDPTRASGRTSAIATRSTTNTNDHASLPTSRLASVEADAERNLTDDFETTDADEEDELLEAFFELDEAEEDDDDDMDFHDAEEGGADEGDAPFGAMNITREQLIRLLNSDASTQFILRNLRSQSQDVNQDDGNGTDGDDNVMFSLSGRRRRSRKGPRTAPEKRYPPVPNPAGTELMSSQTFGSSEPRKGFCIRRQKQLARELLNRELGLDQRTRCLVDSKPLSQLMIPGTKADKIIHFDSRCYSGQFSEDGNFFFACSQDFKVRMYDTSNPYDWKYYKTAHYLGGRWTITDASLSPDNRHLAYSSITPVVCLAPTDPEDSTDPVSLDFSAREFRHDRYFGYGSFGIWSVRFSGDGRELVAGTSDNSVYVYDLEAGRSVLEIPAHKNDVNAVCFGDKSSPHILYSGSDDATLKVWDRRSLADERAAGVFVGHTEGLTYIDSKGDGRYVLSNSKDQTMKLWDLRKMIPAEKFDQLPTTYRRGIPGYDYRGDEYDEDEYVPDPNDCSVVTFRGHSVLKTLIRCHFSPSGSTNSRYVYTGSRDGAVYVYNLDGTIAGRVDVNEATRDSRPLSRLARRTFDYDEVDSNSWVTCVRDASWHPNAPVIAATSWNGYGMHNGTCTTHSWTDGSDEDEGLEELGARVNENLVHDDDYYAAPQVPRRSARNVNRRRLS